QGFPEAGPLVSVEKAAPQRPTRGSLPRGPPRPGLLRQGPLPPGRARVTAPEDWEFGTWPDTVGKSPAFLQGAPSHAGDGHWGKRSEFPCQLVIRQPKGEGGDTAELGKLRCCCQRGLFLQYIAPAA